MYLSTIQNLVLWQNIHLRPDHIKDLLFNEHVSIYAYSEWPTQDAPLSVFSLLKGLSEAWLMPSMLSGSCHMRA